MGEKNERPEIITLYSYQKVWGYEKMLYQITDNLALPTPVVETDGKYFMASLGLVLLAKFILKFPTPNLYAWVFCYIGIPVGMTAILRYKSFDGKKPLTFLTDYLWFLGDRGKQTEFFIPVTEEPTHNAKWRLGYRHRLRLPVAGAEKRLKKE